MARAKVVLVAAGIAALPALWLLQPAGARPAAASPVVDRTLNCTTGVQAGVREVFVDAQSGGRSSTKPGAWEWLPSVQVATPGLATGSQQWVLAVISAGGPLETSPTGGGISVGAGRCKPSRAKVPLAATGLEQQTMRGYSQHWVCFVPRRVLVHVHGTFSTPTRLRGNPFGYLSTIGATARSSQVAVRAESGRPLLFAKVDESGAARLSAAPSCTLH
jgi:hypothetical protein